MAGYSGALWSFFARWASGAGHQIGVLFDIVHIGREHFELGRALQSVSRRSRCHRLRIDAVHLGLKGGNPLVFGHTDRLLGYERKRGQCQAPE
jgi:hypothetical protein